MSKKNKLTPNQDKYKELQRRLKRKLRDVKKRGFTPNRALREEWLNPEVPKGIRKNQLDAFKKAIDDIYKYLRYYDPLKEVYISGEERKKQERREAAWKGWEKRRENILRAKDEIDRFWYDFDEQFPPQPLGNAPKEEELILAQIESMINNWRPDPDWSPYYTQLKTEDKNLLSSVYNGAIDSLGRTQVARNANAHAEEVLRIVNEILYYVGLKHTVAAFNEGKNKIQRVRDILYGSVSTVKESMELTELSERLNESE